MDRRQRLQDVGGYSLDELGEDFNSKFHIESGVLSREPLEDLPEEDVSSPDIDRVKKTSCPIKGGWRRQSDTNRRKGFLRQDITSPV